MLASTDCTLIPGGENTLSENSMESALDLIEEWSDLSGLPFVHGFWVVRPNMLTKEELRTLRESKQRALNEFEEIATKAASATRRSVERASELLRSLAFDLDE